MSEEIFFSVLKDKFHILLSKIIKKKYILLVPQKKFISSSMLDQNFYNNHIFYICPCEPNIYINLNARSLIYNEPEFKSYLGWKNKVIEFKFKEKIIYDLGSDGSIEYMSIDNVCDEVNFNLTVPSSSENRQLTTIKKFNTSEEYVKYYNNFATNNPDYKKAEKKLDHFVNLMKNNCILMKDHEDFYCNIFRMRITGIIEDFKFALKNLKVEENYFNTVVSELVESLIFNKGKMNESIMNSLRGFYEEEEKFIYDKLKETKNEYNLAFVLGPQFKDCQFSQALEKLKELSNQKTNFEKFNVISEISKIIMWAAREASYKVTKVEQSFDADKITNFWCYLFSLSNWKNLIAEMKFLVSFDLFGNSMEEKCYLCTTVLTALMKIQKDVSKNETRLSQNISSSVISTKAYNPLKNSDRNEF